MPSDDPEMHLVDEVAAAVLRSRRYRALAPALVRRIAREELRTANGHAREAVKRSKRRLHQIHGAFAPPEPRYARWSAQLGALRGRPGAARDVARALLRQHASSREREPGLEAFYGELLARVPPPRRILDLACGLNPLAAPWMGLPEGCEYWACDIDEAQVAFVGEALGILGIPGGAFVADLSDAETELPAADLALLLKTLPCLEPQRSGATLELLASVPARHVALSVPARALGDRRRRLGDPHAEALAGELAERGWRAERFEAADELVFLLDRPAARRGAATPAGGRA